MYAGETGSALVSKGVFFYENTYVVPSGRGWGKLEPLDVPSISSPHWPIPDNITLESFRRRLYMDVHTSLKCTYGSHRASLGWFMPLHVFAHIFSSIGAHKTPTMWVCKDAVHMALDKFLHAGWNTKEVHHQGDNIRCSVIMDKIVARYHIGKQNFTMVYPYRRWKRTRNEWEPLDSDEYEREEIQLNVFMHDNEMHTITVNEDWHLGHLREYIAMHFSLDSKFSFAIDRRIIGARSEKATLCRTLLPPHTINLKHS